MKTLNLTSPETSDIKFEISHFPDGQQDCTILNRPGDIIKEGIANAMWYKEEPILIKTRFNSFKDLEIILCATKALRHLGVHELHLYSPWIMGGRSDRRFVVGGTSYLVEVVAPILNAQKYESITVMDVHSDTASACIHNLEVVSNKSLVEDALYSLYPMTWDTCKDNFVLVSPDGGALKRTYQLVNEISFKGEIVTCSKYRDWEGKLSRVEVPIKDSQINKDFILVDDICSRGNTFMNIAKVIKERAGFSGRIYLIVSHYEGTASEHELKDSGISHVYTTNSILDIKSDFITQLNVF